MEELHGRTAVITGAASGMGRAFADRFAAAGMRLVLADVEEAALRRAVAELESDGAEVVGVPTDVSDAGSMDALADAALAAFDRVHLVCNNAGVGSGGPMAELTVTDWAWVLGVNLWGVIHGIRVFLPHLLAQDEGHIVNTASVAGHLSPAGMGPYNASKHAVLSISETLHQELLAGGSNVGVTALCPGLVATRIIESERNRPEHLRRPEVQLTPEGEMRRAAIADLLAAAKPPVEVAELVHDAVLAKQLYLFTDDAFADAIRQRHAAIEAARNPELGAGGLFD